MRFSLWLLLGWELPYKMLGSKGDSSEKDFSFALSHLFSIWEVKILFQ